MDSFLADFFNDLSEFEIKQTLGVSEGHRPGILTKIFRHATHQSANEYELRKKSNEPLGLAQEFKKDSAAIPHWMKSYYIGKRRPLTFTVTNQNEDVILYLRRPFHIFSSTTIIKNSNHEILGYIWRRFNPVIRKYEFHTAERQLLAYIKAPILKPWTFPILNLRKKEIGLIKRKRPSLGEYMTHRETLNIKYLNMSLEEKIMTLATALTICIDMFEPR